jgi:hypothetical protein
VESLIDRIQASVLTAYGPGPRPTFWFVQEAVRTDPHRELIDEFRQSFAIENDTDTNEDVSFNYLLKKDRKLWRLALSMVGPFAVLIGGVRPEDSVIVRMESQDRDEEYIITAVRSRGFTFLDPETIRKPLAVSYPSADDDDEWNVYHALFVHGEVPPP